MIYKFLYLGVWLHPNGSAGCEPRTGSCYFDPEGPNDQVTCSLGYMPFLPAVTRWCEAAPQSMPVSPTKQNILCGGRSALEVILGNRDLAQLTGSSQLQRSLVPRFDIVRDPLPKYVLLIETSAAMADVWKWVRKASQNLIRYDAIHTAWGRINCTMFFFAKLYIEVALETNS